jgi:putative oxidoreductase
MTGFGSDKAKNEVLLVARLLLVALFLITGWSKLMGYAQTVSFMTQVGAPMPELAAAVAIVMEVPVALAIVVGAFARPLAVLLAFYTLGSALIAHHYWTMTGQAQLDNMLHFYKNVSIMGGFLVLYVTGPGKYSLDARFGLLEGGILSSSNR